MRRWAVAILFLAMAGCSSRPDDIPAPTPGFFARFTDDCPDLRGTYTLDHAGGRRQRFLGPVMEQAMDKVPDHHGTWSVDAIDGQQIVLSSWGSTEDTHRAFKQWRNDEPYRYALWSMALTGRSTPRGILMERDPRRTPAHPGLFGQQLTTSISAARYRCKNGWVVFQGDEMPFSEQLDNAQVRMTRARDGGLVAVARFRVKQSFSIWCGDSCKPDIDLGEGQREYWWHAAPAPAIAVTPIDWAAWVADDDRPAEARTRYHDGKLLPYATSEQLQAERRARMGAAGQPPVASAPASVREVETELCPQLATQLDVLGGGLVRFGRRTCTGQRCTLHGHASSHSRLSDTMRAMDEDGFGGLDLALLEPDRGGYRFVLHVDNHCVE